MPRSSRPVVVSLALLVAVSACGAAATTVRAAATTPAPATTAAPALEAQAGLARLGPMSIGLARPITFETGTANIDVDGAAVLRDVAQLLASNPSVTLEIGVHTDSTGSSAFNQRISEERAESVRVFLVGEGVSPARLQAVGYGETRPLDTNSTAEGRGRNRRTELVRTEGRGP